MDARFDTVVVGGGIVGLATALALTDRTPARIAVLEAEDDLARHQTGHNSGVIHSGLYYKPGSLKARNCAEGRDALYRFCAEHGIRHERCGKVVVATGPAEIPALDELERRGRANGLAGLVRLDAAGLREHEPHVRGIAGLHVPDTGIVHFPDVAAAYARIVRDRGHPVLTGRRVLAARRETGGWILETPAGAVRARHLVNCGGLHSDRIARMCGADPGVRIVPFRGEYYELRPEAHHLVRHLIYPVPDPRFPFLGVHFTRMARGGVEAGPNAVLAFRREGYRRDDLDGNDLAELLAFPGFWRMARKFWRMGADEFRRSFSKRRFVQALQRLVPGIRADDLAPGGAGVRAQAVGRDGRLVDDFQIVAAADQVHVLNAPSPAATASLSIGRAIADLARATFT